MIDAAASKAVEVNFHRVLQWGIELKKYACGIFVSQICRFLPQFERDFGKALDFVLAVYLCPCTGDVVDQFSF